MRINYKRFDRGMLELSDRINDFLKENAIHTSQVITLSEDNNWVTLWFWSDKNL